MWKIVFASIGRYAIYRISDYNFFQFFHAQNYNYYLKTIISIPYPFFGNHYKKYVSTLRNCLKFILSCHWGLCRHLYDIYSVIMEPHNSFINIKNLSDKSSQFLRQINLNSLLVFLFVLMLQSYSTTLQQYCSLLLIYIKKKVVSKTISFWKPPPFINYQLIIINH